MIRSMTGFGQAQGNIGGTLYAVEIRSLNSRYFKAIIRLPELWSSFEATLERRLHERAHRGNIHLTVRMKGASADVAHHVNIPALERYIEQLEVVRPDQADMDIRLDLGSLLLLPGVCTPPVLDQANRGAQAELTALVDKAIDSLLAMRTDEGKTIVADLQGNCAVIEKFLAGIAERAPLVIQDYYQRLKRRVEELTGSAELALNEQDLAKEVAVFAERCDIAEEVSRLRSHLSQFRAMADADDQSGRKLEFITQEMLREANTLAAKANDVKIGMAVVEIKTAIDRIKEQTQNVE